MEIMFKITSNNSVPEVFPECLLQGGSAALTGCPECQNKTRGGGFLKCTSASIMLLTIIILLKDSSDR